MEDTAGVQTGFASIRFGTQTKQARSILVEQGNVPEGLLRDPIHRSWHRCIHHGLDPARLSPIDRLQQCGLREVQDRNYSLLAQARPLMDSLYEQIADSRSMVILTDPDGLILHSLGDPDFVTRAQRVALQAGVSWSEVMRGTNAIGTAAVERVPVLVHGSEHFLERNGFLTCSAAPILDHRGDLAGILDISGDHRSYHKHTLALVRMSAQMIERRLLLSKLGGELLMFFHTRPEFAGTLTEGILAFSESGEVRGANQRATQELGMSHEALRGLAFGDLFDMPLESALVHAQRLASTPVSITLRNRQRVYANFQAGTDLAGRRVAVTPLEAPRERSRPGSGGRPITLDSLSFGDPRMLGAIERARRVVGRDIAILIEGESGVGKELFAKAFHYCGPRRDGPFVAVNCAAIPEGLIESELFGYDEGAFTGARRRGSLGRIQQADGGTLFLDEIGDMPLALQSRLLRVLQDRAVTPLGSTKAFSVDISLVCATHRRLKDEVAKGAFREDLFYRLNGLRFALPPLRERTDFPDLVDAILRDEQGEGGRKVTLSPEVMSTFHRYPWPGNLRQLANVIRAALALVGDESEIRCSHLPEDFLEEIEDLNRTRAEAEKATGVPAPEPIAYCGNLEELEVRAIRKALEEHGGNVSAAARQLGISRNTLYRKLGRFQ